MNKQINFGMKLGLSRGQAVKLARLRTPDRVQDFINKIPINYEPKGETNYSVSQVLRFNSAHCLEGAFLAACALWINGRSPLLMNLRAHNDDDHAVTLFRWKKYWGAISKSNHVWLRWREPVYRSLRELAMSYFHEYVSGPTKTMVGYSAAFDLRRFDPALWVTATDTNWHVAEALAMSRHYPVIPKGMKVMRKAEPIVWKADKLREHKQRGA